jgi:hypothetical protein
VKAEDIKVEELPRYREAIAREQFERSEAFIDGPEFIMGVPVRGFSPLHSTLLRSARSPFLEGGKPDPDDVLKFLWVVSESFERACSFRDWLEPFAPRLASFLFRRIKRKYFKRLRKLPYMRVTVGPDPKFELPIVSAIRAYLDRAQADGPGESGGVFRPEFYAPQVGVIASVASAFGWSERDIMRCPFRRLHGYAKWIAMSNNPDCKPINPSDKVRRLEIQELLEN